MDNQLPCIFTSRFFFLHCFGLCLSFKTNYLSVPLPWWQKTRLKESEQLGHAGHLAMSVSQRSGICILSEPRLKHYAWRQHARMRDVAFMTNSAWLGKDRIAAHLGVDFEKLATTPHSQVDGLIWGRLMQSKGHSISNSDTSEASNQLDMCWRMSVGFFPFFLVCFLIW